MSNPQNTVSHACIAGGNNSSEFVVTSHLRQAKAHQNASNLATAETQNLGLREANPRDFYKTAEGRHHQTAAATK